MGNISDRLRRAGAGLGLVRVRLRAPWANLGLGLPPVILVLGIGLALGDDGPPRGARIAVVVGLTLAVSALCAAFLALRREGARCAEATAGLRQREAHLSITLQAIGDGVVSTDRAGVILRMNPAAEALAGCPTEAARGRPFDEVFRLLDDETRERAPSPIDWGPGPSAPRATLLVTADRERWIADSMAPLRDGRGEVEGAVVVLRDVTSQKALERRFRRMLEAAPDAMIVVNAVGGIVVANRQATALFGHTQAELLGRSVESLLPERLRGPHAGHRLRYREQPEVRLIGPIASEIVGLRKDGSEFPAEIGLSPLDLPEGVLTIAAIRDLTRRREEERALRGALAAAEEATSELEVVIDAVAHDLRGPLCAIDGFTQALLEPYADVVRSEDLGLPVPSGIVLMNRSVRPPAETPEATARARFVAAEYLLRVRAAAHRMDALIDDLLRLSGVTAREIAREDLSLTALVRSVGAGLSAASPARRVALVVGEGLAVNADRHLLRIALEALLQNAWTFTAERADPRVEVGQLSGSSPAFFVRDNGIGFDMAHAERLFRPFHRLHAARELGGAGIGLATVRRIISRHGGRVWAEAAENRGATFYFTVSPAAADDVAAAHSPAA